MTGTFDSQGDQAMGSVGRGELPLWAVAAVSSMMLTSAMQGWIATRVGLSVQSLPSVIGTVVTVENIVADNPVGDNNPESNWGNHVIIRSDTGFHVMLAHFLQNSLAVAVGQRVLAGAFLGSCGNSGRSPIPHLHLHAQLGTLAGAPTLPFVLKHYIKRPVAGGTPTLSAFRRAA